ncbi:MAG: hypothetical protein AB8G05_24900 [Oligoflexales bacterium]
MVYKFLNLFFVITVLGCSHSIHLVHTSAFTPYKSPKKGRIVAAKSEQFVVFGFAGDTKYVDQAYKNLQKKCVNKHITGITTQFSTSHGFFSWTNKILLKGLCVG